ncbi:MAG: FIST C-terminal domain-containing protein [Gammaproteobacteria bacterium]|nr:FIST C-terminal domain-containing protein [Gammaproteobacteria bacterium]
MQPFTCTSVTGTDPRAVVERCRAQLTGLSEGADFGFVYVTSVMLPHMDELLRTLRKVTGVQQWLDCGGIGVCANDREIYDVPAAAIMLASFAADTWMALSTHDFDQTLDRATAWEARFPGSLGMVHTDGEAALQDGRLQRLAEELANTFLVGGLSSGETAGISSRQGISGVLFAPQVTVAVDHTQGCTPIGPRHRISSAERNIAITLDDRPALDVLREDIGEVMARDMSRAGNYMFAALSVPGSDTRDYMVRNLIGIDEQRGLVAIGDDLRGQSELTFCRRDGASAREDLTRMTDALRERVGDQPIRGGVYVSCLARGRHQFGDDSEEVRAIQNALGGFPLVGFFANGEIFNGRVYGYTGVLTLFL